MGGVYLALVLADRRGSVSRITSLVSPGYTRNYRQDVFGGDSSRISRAEP